MRSQPSPRGLDLGATLIDTAEMYGEGKSEEVVGEAIDGRRDKVFLVSKVLPQHATRRGTLAACEHSLRRLRTDRLDLYLLHWRGSVPLAETLAAFVDLQKSGKIRYYGVSNLDMADMQELWSLSGGAEVVTNQVLYNLTRRGIECDLLPWLRSGRSRSWPIHRSSRHGCSAIGNSWLLPRDAKMTPAQVALAWLLAKDGVIAIPKSADLKHLEENLGALRIS